jgi:4-amino-4-deoxy-L-arabinose transferase-like glycosyltransferase
MSDIRLKPQTEYLRHTRLTYVLVAVALAYFAVMTSRQIALPGLYYDEVLFVNAATGGVYNGFVVRRILGVPVMLMPYLGALKAWLYFPIFALFGISPETIRLPAILISLLTLVLTFKLARLTFRSSYSALLVLLMAVDPIFIFMSKLDSGPIVLMMLFKTLALWFFFRFILTSSPRYLWGLSIACALGIYDKLNFIWFVLALIIAALLVFRRELRLVAAHHRTHFVWPVGALLLLLAGSGLYAVRLLIETQQSDVSLLNRLKFVVRLYLATMNGRDLWFMARPFSTGTLTNWITIALIGMIIVAGTSRLVRRRQSSTLSPTDRVVVFYFLIFVIILVQILLTSAANSPHHIMMLYPFHHVLLIGVANHLSDMHLVDSRPGRWVRAATSLRSGGRLKLAGFSMPWSQVRLAVVLVVALLVASQITVGLRYQAAINERVFDHMWSPAIYELAAYVDQREVDAIVSADWGIHNQVVALSRPEVRGRYADLWQEFTWLRPEQERTLTERFFVGKRVLVLVFAADKGDARGRQHFLSFAENCFGGAVLERVIANDRGEPIFRVYYIDARTRCKRHFVLGGGAESHQGQARADCAGRRLAGKGCDGARGSGSGDAGAEHPAHDVARRSGRSHARGDREAARGSLGDR